ncbi:MAG: CapA family protein [Candidatus Saccharibacteria bacterium]
MKSVVKKSHFRRTAVIIICALAFVLSGLLVCWLWAQQSGTSSVDGSAKIESKPKTQKILSNVLFTGNIFWGRYINDWSMSSPLKYQYPFSRLNEFNRDQYNAWIAGLECPTVAGVNITSAEQEALLQFNCSPDYLPEAAKWFTAVTLANNHADNQGVGGFDETRQQLDKNGIQYFGHYDYQNVDDVCEVIGLPATVSLDDGSQKDGSLPIAMCGFHGVFGIPTDESIAVMQKYATFMPVIAMPHMGAEYKSVPDEIKINLYRKMVDNGADVVIGDHPHWIQNTESYNGHLIVYSMGNFMFDQQSNTEVTRSAAIKMSLMAKVGDLDSWLKIGDQCRSFKDSCLADVKSQNLSKLGIEYKFGAIGTNDSGKINKPATPEQQASILQRLNWQSTMNSLRSPYGSL